MKLYKALKLKKKIVGEIAKLKEQISQKNSYVEGSLNAEKYDINELYDTLLKKVDNLVGLKFAINEANYEIQNKIYVLSELKALIVFWKDVSVIEGIHKNEYEREAKKYNVHIDEIKRDNIIAAFQKRIDAIQEEIDLYNYTTDIPWDEANNI